VSVKKVSPPKRAEKFAKAAERDGRLFDASVLALFDRLPQLGIIVVIVVIVIVVIVIIIVIIVVIVIVAVVGAAAVTLVSFVIALVASDLDQQGRLARSRLEQPDTVQSERSSRQDMNNRARQKSRCQKKALNHGSLSPISWLTIVVVPPGVKHPGGRAGAHSS
jgi:hypothetical protein